MEFQPWHSEEWGKRFSAALKRRGWNQRRYAQEADIGDAEASRLAKGVGTLPAVLQACELLHLSPPEQLISAEQSRLLKAMEGLWERLEVSPAPETQAAAEAMMAAFVAQVEAIAKRMAMIQPEPDPDPTPNAR